MCSSAKQQQRANALAVGINQELSPEEKGARGLGDHFCCPALPRVCNVCSAKPQQGDG